jgi:hypothetical protein
LICYKLGASGSVQKRSAAVLLKHKDRKVSWEAKKESILKNLESLG